MFLHNAILYKINFHIMMFEVMFIVRTLINNMARGFLNVGLHAHKIVNF